MLSNTWRHCSLAAASIKSLCKSVKLRKKTSPKTLLFLMCYKMYLDYLGMILPETSSSGFCFGATAFLVRNWRALLESWIGTCASIMVGNISASFDSAHEPLVEKIMKKNRFTVVDDDGGSLKPRVFILLQTFQFFPWKLIESASTFFIARSRCLTPSSPLYNLDACLD